MQNLVGSEEICESIVQNCVLSPRLLLKAKFSKFCKKQKFLTQNFCSNFCFFCFSKIQNFLPWFEKAKLSKIVAFFLLFKNSKIFFPGLKKQKFQKFLLFFCFSGPWVKIFKNFCFFFCFSGRYVKIFKKICFFFAFQKFKNFCSKILKNQKFQKLLL